MSNEGEITETILGDNRLTLSGSDRLERLEVGDWRLVKVERIGDIFLLTVRPFSLPVVLAVAFLAQGEVLKAHCDVLDQGLSKEDMLAALTKIPSPHVSANVTSDCNGVKSEWQPSCHYGEAEVRLKKDTGIFDEVVFSDGGECVFRVKQMDSGHYCIAAYPTSKSWNEYIQINLATHNGKVVGRMDVVAGVDLREYRQTD